MVSPRYSVQPWLLLYRRMSELHYSWIVCEGHSIALGSQWFKRIIRGELQSDAANDGFLPVSPSLSHSSTSLVFHSIHLTPAPSPNFLRIIRPSSEPGQWKTSLQIAPSTSRFSSQRTSSTSNLQVGRECEMKYTGCDLRCVYLSVCLVWMQLLLFEHIAMQEIMGWHPLENNSSWPKLTGVSCSVCDWHCVVAIRCRVPSLSAWFLSLKIVFSISVPVQQRGSLSSRLSEGVLDRLARFGCKPSEGFSEFFCVAFLESVSSSPALSEDASQSSASERRGTKLSLSPSLLSHTSFCLRPWRTSNSIRAFRPHPSCLYQWLMFYSATLAKKIPFFWWVLPLP